MSEYVAPLRDMQFVLRELAGLDAVGGLPGYEEVNEELASAILEEAGKFASGDRPDSRNNAPATPSLGRLR